MNSKLASSTSTPYEQLLELYLNTFLSPCGELVNPLVIFLGTIKTAQSLKIMSQTCPSDLLSKKHCRLTVFGWIFHSRQVRMA